MVPIWTLVPMVIICDIQAWVAGHRTYGHHGRSGIWQGISIGHRLWAGLVGFVVINGWAGIGYIWALAGWLNRDLYLSALWCPILTK